MNARVGRYAGPALSGAAVVFAIRLLFGGLPIALTGIVVFAVVLGVLALLSRKLNWQEAPVMYSAIAAFAATLAFLATGPLAGASA